MTPNQTAEQVTAEGAGGQAARLGAPARSLKVIRSDKSYLAVTLTSDGDGWDFSFHSSFAGFPDGKGADHGVELREPSLVYPEKMTRIWDTMGQSWIVVNEDAQLAVYLRLGGHALIADDVAQRHLAEFIEPQAYVNIGPMGFRLYDPESREARKRRPRPQQKKRVLARDGHTCQMCGNAPAKNDELSQLQTHHIKPFGTGGPTAEDNLITLCRSCHEGLDPHDQPWLFWYSDAPMYRALDELDAEAHDKGVEAYRRLMAKAIDKLDRREPVEPSRSRAMGLQGSEMG